MAIRVGINGFGRIGRNFFRAQQQRGADIEIVAVNDLGDAKTMAHLLKYDSVLGPFAGEVSLGDGVIEAGGETMKMLSERDPAALPWGDLGVDVVLESTGFFTDRAGAQKHLDAGTTFEAFLADAKVNPKASSITGVVCGVRVENIDDPLMQKIRYLDKLVDELAKGRPMEKVLRS